MDDFQKFLNFFKALGNESRLKIIVILADGECTVREIAELTDLKEPTVSEHLAILKEVGLVSVRAEGNFRYYSYNAQVMDGINRELFNRERMAALLAIDRVHDADDRRVLRNYLDEHGKLKTIPAVRKNLMVVLKWLAEQFEYDKQYPEKEVNAILNRYHADHATLRRELVSQKLMMRDKGIYWRVKPTNTPDTL